MAQLSSNYISNKMIKEIKEIIMTLIYRRYFYLGLSQNCHGLSGPAIATIRSVRRDAGRQEDCEVWLIENRGVERSESQEM